MTTKPTRHDEIQPPDDAGIVDAGIAGHGDRALWQVTLIEDEPECDAEILRAIFAAPRSSW